MKKRSVIIFIISLILIIIPFLYNGYNLYRLLCLLIGILLSSISLLIYKKNSIFMVIIVPLIILTITYMADMFLFYKFNRFPIYVSEVKSSNNVNVYNSFFYRIYKCNQDYIFDYGYLKNYQCGNNDLDSIDINDLLKDVQSSYTSYKNKFIKVHGKISKIVNLDSIELSLWSTADNPINGYVLFNHNYNLKINTNEDLNKYHIYEEIDIVGRVSKLERKDDKYTIILTDAKILDSDLYNIWTYEIVGNDKEFKNIVNNYYFYGISSLNIKYSDNLIYELSYLINDKKMSIDDLIEDNNVDNVYKDENEKAVAWEYKLDKFKVLKCSNDKIIIANKKLKLNGDACNITVDE